jgi:hypothetical protein
MPFVASLAGHLLPRWQDICYCVGRTFVTALAGSLMLTFTFSGWGSLPFRYWGMYDNYWHFERSLNQDKSIPNDQQPPTHAPTGYEHTRIFRHNAVCGWPGYVVFRAALVEFEWSPHNCACRVCSCGIHPAILWLNPKSPKVRSRFEF